MSQGTLFNKDQFAGTTCTKCGHERQLHKSRGCSGMVGALECKCYRFAHNPPPPTSDRQQEEV